MSSDIKQLWSAAILTEKTMPPSATDRVLVMCSEVASELNKALSQDKNFSSEFWVIQFYMAVWFTEHGVFEQNISHASVAICFN